MDGGIGIQLGANGGTASSEQNTLNVQYAENSYTEFEFDVRPDSTYRYIQTYLDSIMFSLSNTQWLIMYVKILSGVLKT